MIKYSHIALNARDPIALERYYTKNFGFQRARVLMLGTQQIVFIKLGGVYLEIFQADGDRPTPAPKNDGDPFVGMRHLAFQVDDVDAVVAAMGDDAKIAFGPFGFDDFIPGWRTVWLSDPEGNIVEVSQGFVDEANPPAL